MGEIGAQTTRPPSLGIVTSNGDRELLPVTSKDPAFVPADFDVANTHQAAVTARVVPAIPTAPAASEYFIPPSTNRLHYLEALVSASHAINAILEPAKVAEVLAHRSAAILNVSGIVVLSVDDHDQVRVLWSQGVSDCVGKAHEGLLSESIVGRALQAGRPFAAWDVRRVEDERLAKAAQTEGIVSGVCVPMYFGGKAVGGLIIYSHDARHFTDDEFNVLSLLAAQGGIALTNARAYRELQTQAAEVRAGFQRVGEALSASLDIGETLHLIVQLAVDITPADAGAIYLLQEPHEGTGMQIAGMRGLERRSIRRFRVMPVSVLAERALKEQRIVYVPDTRRVSEIAFPTLRLSVEEVADTRSVLCVPLQVGDRNLGVLEYYSAVPNAFSQREMQVVGTFAHQATVAIERARLYAQECNIAQTLQRAFLPELPDSMGGFHIGRIYVAGNTAAQVGGDSYDVFTLPDGRIAAFIADVSGQGPEAATLAVMVKYTVRAFALENPDPASVLHRVNEVVRLQTNDSTFVTIIFALLDPAKQTVTLSNAAHPSPLLWNARTKSCAEVTCEQGLICGFLPGEEYPSIGLSLHSGDTLFLYTDGVIEARKDKVLFGPSRLEKAVCENAHLPAQELAGALYVTVAEYVDGGTLDDLAVLVLRAM
jgi:phosphoserine phosphatase RsbU/P